MRRASPFLPTGLPELMRRMAVTAAIDVGANEGQWAAALRHSGFGGPIHSFEPAAATFATLERAAAPDPHWHAQRLALGEADGTLTLRLSRNNQLSSALPARPSALNHYPQEFEATGVEQVPVRRLDTLLPELIADLHRERLLLKMDTQGFDQRVFRGAAGVMPAIVMVQGEFSVLPLYEGATSWLEALAEYAAAGYLPAAVSPVNRQQPYGVLREFDGVLVRHAPLRAVPGREPPRISVIVTACGDSPALRQCLDRLAPQCQAQQAELLLMINDAPQALDGVAREALEPRCDRLLFEPRPGKSHALNSAVRAARGTVLAFTDDDAQPAPDWLATLTQPLLDPHREPLLVGCGGPVQPVYPPEGVPAWLPALLDAHPTHFLTPKHDLGPAAIDYLPRGNGLAHAPLGANCAYRREVFDAYHYDIELGPNRVTGLRGGEDYLLGQLLIRDGYRLRYLPQARVAHPVDPARLGVRHVERAFHAHGVEWVRIWRALGWDSNPLDMSQARARRKLWKTRWRLLRARLPGARVDADDMMVWRMRHARRRGMLAELRRQRLLAGARRLDSPGSGAAGAQPVAASARSGALK